VGSQPESFQFDEAADRVYANVPKQLGVALIDWKKRAVIGKWALGLSFCELPDGLGPSESKAFCWMSIARSIGNYRHNFGPDYQGLANCG
jgi:hypothetical protein